ncbi:unnamed protein product [Linum tenue]|nr:unnamed protein product [Linum tenue]
MLLRAA